MGKIVKWSFTFSFTLNEDNMKWIFARILEPSSWAGIGIIVTAIHMIMDDGANGTDVGQMITGLVAVFMPGKTVVDRVNQGVEKD